MDNTDTTLQLPVSRDPNGFGLFGQLVIGPPGSGKTTYCAAMCEFLTKLGRKVAVINLDPANDYLPYESSLNLSDLIRLDEVMDYLGLGPNGGLIYCMEYLYENRDWLAYRLGLLKQDNSKTYLIFDLPGQVELYTHAACVYQLVSYLTSKPSTNQMTDVDGINLHLTAVYLTDSHYCCDAGNFISSVLTSLSAMLQLSLPHVNVLSKADLIEQFSQLDFNLDFFTEVLDLNYLLDRLHGENNDPFYSKYKRLNKVLVDLIQDKSLVQFLLLDVQDMSQLERVMRYVDRASGYVFGPNEEHSLQALMHMASGVEIAPDWIGVAQERYMRGTTDEDGEEANIDLLA